MDAAFFSYCIARTLIAVEGVADGSSEAKYVIGVEVGGVIEDAVVMSFGADKDLSPHAVVDSRAHVE